ADPSRLFPKSWKGFFQKNRAMGGAGSVRPSCAALTQRRRAGHLPAGRARRSPQHMRGSIAGREKFSAESGAPPLPTVCEFFLRRAGVRKANLDAAERGQLCDRNVRDDFTQPSNSPDHGIKPVWRAINGAVPLAAEGHHFALELIEPAAMQDTLLFI